MSVYERGRLILSFVRFIEIACQAAQLLGAPLLKTIPPHSIALVRMSEHEGLNSDVRKRNQSLAICLARDENGPHRNSLCPVATCCRLPTAKKISCGWDLQTNPPGAKIWAVAQVAKRTVEEKALLAAESQLRAVRVRALG